MFHDSTSYRLGGHYRDEVTGDHGITPVRAISFSILSLLPAVPIQLKAMLAVAGAQTTVTVEGAVARDQVDCELRKPVCRRNVESVSPIADLIAVRRASRDLSNQHNAEYSNGS